MRGGEIHFRPGDIREWIALKDNMVPSVKDVSKSSSDYIISFVSLL